MKDACYVCRGFPKGRAPDRLFEQGELLAVRNGSAFEAFWIRFLVGPSVGFSACFSK